MGSKEIKPYIHEGEALTPVKVLGVTLYADPHTVKDYNESLNRVRQAFRRLKALPWKLPIDESKVIDQE